MRMAKDGAAATFDESFLTRQRRALAHELVAQERNLAAALAQSDECETGAAEGADDGERSQQLVERVRTDSLEQQARARMEEIESATDRLDGGSYGMCTRCGAPVDRERLKALPEVALCSTCKSGGSSPLARWR